MPGRLAIYDDKNFKNDAKNFIKNDMVQQLNPKYNIAPTLPIPVLLNNGNYLYSHFGYLPSWAKSKKSMNINARSESIFEKQTFRDSFRLRRCLIPVNGFFEWEVEDKQKTPYFVKHKEKNYFAIAGIWDEWFDTELNMNIVTVALITCDANEKLKKIHHRMPVILEKEQFSSWLTSSSLKDLNSMFDIYSSQKLELYEVTSDINKVTFDKPTCIEKIEKEDLGQLSLF
jgi:putative SOS response-associated peptidase YedK